MRSFPSFTGIPIVVSYDRPGYVLPDDLMLPPKFREDFNRWAAAFFRPKPSLILDDQVIHDKVRDVFYMNERTFNKFRRATAEQQPKDSHGNV